MIQRERRKITRVRGAKENKCIEVRKSTRKVSQMLLKDQYDVRKKESKERAK